MKNIAAALVKAQKNYAPALRSSVNPHFRSKYAALDACVEAVLGALNEAGVALIQRNYECDDGVIVETVFLHESGEMFEAGKLHVPAAKADAQGFGSALTYARRYSLMAACGIAPEDDDGNAASKEKPPMAPKPPMSQESFERQFPGWRDAILSGRLTKAGIIAKCAERASLSEDQIAYINGIKEEN